MAAICVSSARGLRMRLHESAFPVRRSARPAVRRRAVKSACSRRQVLGSVSLPCEIRRRTEARLQRSLRLGAGAADARRAELILQQAQLGIAADIAHHHERLPRAHPLSVRTRISRTIPPSWCCTVSRFSSTLTWPFANHGARQGRRRRPERDQARDDCQRHQHPSGLPDELGARVRIGAALRQQVPRRTMRIGCLHADAVLRLPRPAQARVDWSGRRPDASAAGSSPRAEGFERSVVQHRQLVELRHERPGDVRP